MVTSKVMDPIGNIFVPLNPMSGVSDGRAALCQSSSVGR